ncbi:MAG: protein translocase SEC61 complex subunit gamma [Candidatus Aenigmatarchaeota archaeon]
MKLLSNALKKIKEALESYRRVLIIARKPDKEEFIKTVKICLIGIGLVGFIGFIIYTFSILFLS